MQSFFLCGSFYSCADNQSVGTRPALCSLPESHLANIYGEHTNSADSQSILCFLSVCMRVPAPFVVLTNITISNRRSDYLHTKLPITQGQNNDQKVIEPISIQQIILLIEPLLSLPSITSLLFDPFLRHPPPPPHPSCLPASASPLILSFFVILFYLWTLYLFCHG